MFRISTFFSFFLVPTLGVGMHIKNFEWQGF